METKNEHKYEDILRLLEANDNMSEEEAERLLQDEEVRHNCEDAQLLTMALMEKDSSINTESALSEFRHRHRRPTMKIALFVAVAAAVALLIVFLMPVADKEEQLVAHQPKNITLSKVNGVTQTVNDGVTLQAILRQEQQAPKAKTQPAEAKPIENYTLNVPAGKSITVALPDGSTAYVHPCSTLKFPSQFTGKKRKVTLQGEAYFRVKHRTHRPFVVESEGMTVTDLGTEFDVTTYEGAPLRVTLVKGAVEVKYSSWTSRLKPGEQVQIYDGMNTYKVVKANLSTYTKWLKGFFSYENAPIADVVENLCRYYDVTPDNSKPKKMNIWTTTVTFEASRSLSLTEVLDIINSKNNTHLTFANGKIAYN